MKLQEVIAFHTTFFTNLENWKAGNKGRVEAQWRQAFAAAESENDGTLLLPKSKEILNALIPSMQAHIRIDLPRAVAGCYATHYAGIRDSSLDDFWSDFDAMGPVFDAATASIRPEIEGETTWLDPGNIDATDSAMPIFFNIEFEREMVKRKAEGLADNMGGSPDRARKGVHRKVSHLNHRDQTFKVDGSNMLNEVDWANQPGTRPDAPGPEAIYGAAPEPPPFPEKLFFERDRPKFEEKLEDCIRSDQDLAPLVSLAEWTREVRDAQISLEGSASEEGVDGDNHNLGETRSGMVGAFLLMVGADIHNNVLTESSLGEQAGSPRRDYRYVRLTVRSPGTSRQQHRVPNQNLPSEVQS